MLMTKERNVSVARTTQLDAEVTELKDNEAWYVTEQEKLTVDVSMLTDAWDTKKREVLRLQDAARLIQPPGALPGILQAATE